jgi:uncharacterized protein (TIGR00369 family)
MQTLMTIPDLAAFLDAVFPQVRGRFEILEIAPHAAKVRMTARDEDLRPGGTVSGPAMFALADVAFYIVTLAMIGPEPLTVTTSATIDFLRKPAPGRMVASARILKLGRSLSVGDVLLRSEGMAAPVARAGFTYSIPPVRASRP